MAFERIDQTVQVEEIPIPCPSLPAAFHGARVAVVADVHFPDALLSIPALVRLVADARPDAIFLPGDLTNSYTFFDGERLYSLARALSRIAPCFAVAGNHEQRLGREPRYAAILTKAGVHYLDDTAAEWKRGGDMLTVFGMGHRRPQPIAHKPVIVLAHKPDFFPYYCRARWNVVVCGHAHGGQVRLGGRALYAPGQGLFPAYTGGLYIADGTTMAVSRGLGNSSVPWRGKTRPHLPILL